MATERKYQPDCVISDAQYYTINNHSVLISYERIKDTYEQDYSVRIRKFVFCIYVDRNHYATIESDENESNEDFNTRIDSILDKISKEFK